MKIDHGKKHMLINFKNSFPVLISDHKSLVMDAQLEVPPTKKQKKEILDVNDYIPK